MIIFALCGGIYLTINEMNRRAVANNEHWHSLWMPRYLGIVWPAFAIVVAAALLRLPTRPLRYAAIVLVLAARTSRSSPRVFIKASRRLSSSPATCWRPARIAPICSADSPKVGAPVPAKDSTRRRRGAITWSCSRTSKFTPEEFRANRQRFFTEFQAHLTNNPAWLASDVKRLPQVSHLVVWDKIERGSSEMYPDDLLRSQLGADWRKDSDEVFSGFDHWTWQKLFQVRRREYVRTGH